MYIFVLLLSCVIVYGGGATKSTYIEYDSGVILLSW